MVGPRYLHLLLRCLVFRFAKVLDDLRFGELSTYVTYTELRMFSSTGSWQ